MSDNWGHFFAQIGDHRASFVFDDGISSEINDLPDMLSVWIKLPLHEWNEQGLTTDDEAVRLGNLEDRIEEALKVSGGMLLGRVTYNRNRHVMALSRDGLIATSLQSIARRAGYEGEISVDEDPQRDIYWRDLYPTDEDRQVMNDMALLNRLAENGDQTEQLREVEHWTYFTGRKSAKAFAKWAKSAKYTGVAVEKDPDDGTAFVVKTRHIGAMWLNEVTSHTLAHHRKALEFAGRYDGWQTFIVKS
jgi:hypothetical protein